MMGSRIFALKNKALKLFLQSLPQGCMFQVISFGWNFSYFLKEEKMQPYTDEILK
jgi:hypothetical protein